MVQPNFQHCKPGSMTYAEKLKDPRWQRKRLEIFQRDGFACCWCKTTDETLVVHHLKYTGDPWEAPNEDLMTLCENCHREEKELRSDVEKMILSDLKRYAPTDVDAIRRMIKEFELVHVPDVVFSAVGWFMSDRYRAADLVRNYFKYLRKDRQKTEEKEKISNGQDQNY